MATVRAVSFKEKEIDLVNYVGDRDFSYYIKSLIRKDMEKEEPTDTVDKVIKKKRNINFDF